ncbi:glycosyltransferase family 9 protein [bacterium]|nr:glycosyltransferase family 9 protein [bacterium]
MDGHLNILVTRLQNIGDTLVFIPAVRALRLALPHARITYLGKHAGGLEIMRNCPYIDETLVVRDRSLGEKLRLLREFRGRKLDYFIISPQDRGRVPWAWLGGAWKIAGYARICNYGEWKREKLPWLLDIAPMFDVTRSEVEHCLRLVEDVLDDLGVALPADAGRELEYSWYQPDDIERAHAFLRTHGIADGQPFVAIAPVSKRAAKNWARDRYIEIVSRMRQAWRAPVIFIGGIPEKPEIEALAAAAGTACVNAAGELTLAQTAVLLERARLFLGSDSGPAFLASAVATPVVALYGPADIYRWSPPATRAPRINIFHPTPTNPCRHQVCPQEHPCMSLITVDEVWEACAGLWRE